MRDAIVRNATVVFELRGGLGGRGFSRASIWPNGPPFVSADDHYVPQLVIVVAVWVTHGSWFDQLSLVGVLV